MTTYAIGDVHSCADSLKTLLKLTPPDSNYLFIGDLINRGPKSLKSLRMMQKLGPRAKCLLGNHELHMLAVYCGKRPMGRSDTFQEIFDAPDCEELMDWVRTWPMALEVDGFLAVHAACHWSWTKSKTLKYGAEVEKFLQSKHWKEDIGELFGKTQWEPGLRGYKRLRAIVNVLTRTRYLTEDGYMDFKEKMGPDDTPGKFIPWYEFPDRKTLNVPIVFGHWSTLGKTDWPNVYPLDTGCLWGGSLTARSLSFPMDVLNVPSTVSLNPW